MKISERKVSVTCYYTGGEAVQYFKDGVEGFKCLADSQTKGFLVGSDDGTEWNLIPAHSIIRLKLRHLKS